MAPSTRSTSRASKAAAARLTAPPAERGDGGDAAVNTRPAALNLDALEREGGAPLPFDFELAGRRYLMADPQGVDWQDLLVALNSPIMFFRLVMSADDRDAFFAAKLPGWKLNRLIEEYQKHYGLPNGPNANGLPR